VTATPEVREAMLAAIPSLRAFAIALTRHTDHADDLVQDTTVRALAYIEKFEPGTNMSAWLFTLTRPWKPTPRVSFPRALALHIGNNPHRPEPA